MFPAGIMDIYVVIFTIDPYCTGCPALYIHYDAFRVPGSIRK